jgi:predicted Zn-dependent peptidase
MPSREVDLAFDLVSDVVGNPLLEAEALARQRQIALQEIAQRNANPDIVLEELFVATLFGDHPASGPVLGNPGSVRLIDPDAIAEQRERFWGATNLVLAVVGRIRPAEALARAEQYFGGLSSGTRNDRAAMPPRPPEEEIAVTTSGGEQQAQFRVGYVVPGLLEADRYPLVVFNSLMTGSSGRLFRSLRSARGIAYFAGSAYTSYTDAGAWYATAEVDPANIDKAGHYAEPRGGAAAHLTDRRPPDPGGRDEQRARLPPRLAARAGDRVHGRVRPAHPPGHPGGRAAGGTDLSRSGAQRDDHCDSVRRCEGS